VGSEVRWDLIRGGIHAEPHVPVCLNPKAVCTTGMLKQTFSTESFANAEFRCFDMTATGDFKPSFRMA
jgi:hypothetical protein